MRVRTLTVALSAALVMASSATAATAKQAPLRSSHAPKAVATPATKAARGKTRVSGTTPDTVYVAPFGSVRIVTPGYIYFPAPAASSNAGTDVSDCASTGNGCTDEQLCEIWGENCPG